MSNYTSLLKTAREQAEERLAKKGLTGSSFQSVEDDPMDAQLLSPSSAPLVSKRPKAQPEVEDEEDFMTKYYNKLYAQNKELKQTVAEFEPPEVALDTTTGTEVGTKLVSDLEEALGITRAQAAGLVGNLDHETGGFKFMQELDPAVPGSRGGLGFAQWTGTRRKEFEAWAASNDMDVNSYEANLGYLVHEISNTSEGRFLEELEGASTAEEAARIVSRKYLRPGKPNMPSRISKALSYVGDE
jgi:hypothetical protein